MSPKSSLKASILNTIVPGLGHAYAHQWKKGLLLFIFLILLILSLRFLAVTFPIFVGILVLFICYYLYLLVSGYRSVVPGKLYPAYKIDKWYFYVLLILVWVAFLEFLKYQPIQLNSSIHFAGIPTPAMDPALQVGDHVAYKKTKSVDRNDVVIFNYPTDRYTLYIKRCIGMPGDSLVIKNKTVFINGHATAKDSDFKHRYLITTNGTTIGDAFFQKQGIRDYTQTGIDYTAFLTDMEVEKLQTFSFIKQITPLVAPAGERDPSIYPGSTYLNWNTDFFGPLYIPKKGDRIELNEINKAVYAKCIQNEEPDLRLNETKLPSYQFKENYYFMMGDNRHNSFDSRYLGFVPEHLLIGKALYLFWSNDFNRVGKSMK